MTTRYIYLRTTFFSALYCTNPVNTTAAGSTSLMALFTCSLGNLQTAQMFFSLLLFCGQKNTSINVLFPEALLCCSDFTPRTEEERGLFALIHPAVVRGERWNTGRGSLNYARAYTVRHTFLNRMFLCGPYSRKKNLPG